MRRLLTRLAAMAVPIGLLVACGAPVSPTQLQFSLAPSGTLGYETSEDTITIAGRNLRFRNSAGGHGVTITGYSIAFYTQTGAQVIPGDNRQEGSMSMYIPPGIVCDEAAEVVGCQMGDDGWRFGPSPEIVSEQSYQLLPVAVATAHIFAGTPVGWHGIIEFTGVTATGTTFTSAGYQVAIAPPD